MMANATIRHQPWCRLSREPLPDHPMIGAGRCRCSDDDMEAAYLKGRASSAMAQPAAGPYSIGSEVWPGLSKVIEESGEVLQVIGKIEGAYPSVEHWDGTNLRERLQEELGDLSAAIVFVKLHCGLAEDAIERRAAQKLALFERWHADQQTGAQSGGGGA